jgi:type IV pilus assembly protein PilE
MCMMNRIKDRCNGMSRMNIKGVTLIELMIALAVMGILTLVAYPSYQNSVRKTRRADGVAAALAIQAAQEKFRGSCQFYAQSLGSSNICGTTAALSTVEADTVSNEGYYNLSIVTSSATGNAYTINIDPTGTQADDTDCDPMRFTVNSTTPLGAKTPAACW